MSQAKTTPTVRRAVFHLSCAAALALAHAGCAGMFQRKAPESVEILARTDPAAQVKVKHILIGWSWLDTTYRQAGLTLDRRAEGRTQTEAEQLAQQLLDQVRAGAPIEPLMKQYSEDEGSAQSGRDYPVNKDSRMADDFIELSLRLRVGESGIVKSKYGLHVIQRVQ